MKETIQMKQGERFHFKDTISEWLLDPHWVDRTFTARPPDLQNSSTHLVSHETHPI